VQAGVALTDILGGILNGPTFWKILMSHTVSHNNKIAASMTQKWQDPDFRASEAKRRALTQEHRAATRVALAAMWADPACKVRMTVTEENTVEMAKAYTLAELDSRVHTVYRARLEEEILAPREEQRRQLALARESVRQAARAIVHEARLKGQELLKEARLKAKEITRPSGKRPTAFVTDQSILVELL
jgi:hypothetical protein